MAPRGLRHPRRLAGPRRRRVPVLPVDPALAKFDPEVAAPAFVHWTGPNSATPVLEYGDALVPVSGGRLAVAAASLSPRESITRFLIQDSVDVALRVLGERFGPPRCTDPFDRPNDVVLQSGVLNLDGAIAPGGWPVKHCLQQGSVTDLDLRLRNATDTLMKFDRVLGDGAFVVGDEPSDVTQPAALMVKGVWDGLGHGLVMPGSTVDLTVPAGTETTVNMQPDVVATTTYALAKFLLAQTVEQLPLPAAAKIVAVVGISETLGCAVAAATAAAGGWEALSVHRPSEIANAVLGFLGDCVDKSQLLVRVALASGQDIGSAKDFEALFKRLDLYLDVADGAVTGVDTGVWGAWVPNGLIIVEHRQPEPLYDARGNLYGPGCVTPHGDGLTWLVDDACQQAFLASLSAQPITCDQTGTCTTTPQPPTGNPQPGGPGTAPTANPCVVWDYLAGKFVLTAGAGQGCLLPEQYTWCGYGGCVPLPEAFGRVVELTDGRSGYIRPDGQWFHLTSRAAYFDCLAGGQPLRSPHTSTGKWFPDNLNNLRFGGDIAGC